MISVWSTIAVGIVTFLVGWIACAIILYGRIVEYEEVIGDMSVIICELLQSRGETAGEL